MSYLEARKELGLSREKLSSLAKLAGIGISPASIKKLEDDGEKAIGSRGISNEAATYIAYVLGLSTDATIDWTSVQAGAPVVVAGEKGVFSFGSYDGSNVTVFGDKLQTVEASRARLAAHSSVPSADNAHLFEARTRGDGGVYARQVLNYVASHGDMPHGVGALAAALGLDNGVVSRTVAGLIKSGRLVKVSRGVVALGTVSDEPEAAEIAAPEVETEAAGDDVPQF